MLFFYGYNFSAKKGEPIETMIGDAMQAYLYAISLNQTFCFLQDTYDLSIYDDHASTRVGKAWLSFIEPFPIVPESECMGVWPFAPLLDYSIPHFVNPDMDVRPSLSKWTLVSDFVRHSVVQSIQHELETYPWWFFYSCAHQTTYASEEEYTSEQLSDCESALLAHQSSARYQIESPSHYGVCVCITCRLRHTVSKESFCQTVAEIMGETALAFNECCLTRYGKHDYASRLTTPPALVKGDIEVTIFLTPDWNIMYGGLVSLCEGNPPVLKTSVVPCAGTALFVKWDGSIQSSHVSHVTLDKPCIALTVWFRVG